MRLELPPDAADRDVMFWWRVGDPPPDDYDVTSGGKWTHLQSQPKGTPLETTTAEAKAKSPRQYGNFKKTEGGFGPEIGLARELRAREGRPSAIESSLQRHGVDAGIGIRTMRARRARYRALVTETKAAMAAARAQGISPACARSCGCKERAMRRRRPPRSMRKTWRTCSRVCAGSWMRRS